jgi:hypothetical protein
MFVRVQVTKISPGNQFTLDRKMNFLTRKFKNLYLLDANASTIEFLMRKFENAKLYRAPERLSFENGAVSFIHCSHLVEHLHHEELYSFMKEIDRDKRVRRAQCSRKTIVHVDQQQVSNCSFSQQYFDSDFDFAINPVASIGCD